MKAVAVRLGLIVVLALARTPIERAWQSAFSARAQSAPANSLIDPAQGQLQATGRTIYLAQGQLPSVDRPVHLAQGQLPSIDRPIEAPSHDTASATRFQGHFFFQTEVNGTAVPMIFDTGASYVSLRAEDAVRAGIDPSSLNYSMRLSSANGIVDVAPVMIRVMKVGGITLTNVQATVARPGAQRENLLGQSFMTRMAGFTTEGDTLTLRGK